jgi:hypothetical protein
MSNDPASLNSLISYLKRKMGHFVRVLGHSVRQFSFSISEAGLPLVIKQISCEKVSP